MTEGEVQEARAAIAASKDSADRLIAASRELESLVFGVVQDESNSLAGTEVDIADAKLFLNAHKLKAARKSVKKAEQSLALLEEDVLHLRRNIAMLHRLLNEKKINEELVKRLVEEFDAVHSEIDRHLFYLVTKERLDEYGMPIILTESE